MAVKEAAGRAEGPSGVGRRPRPIRRPCEGGHPLGTPGRAAPDTASGTGKAAGADHLERDPARLVAGEGAAAGSVNRGEPDMVRLAGTVEAAATVAAPVGAGLRAPVVATARVSATGRVAMGVGVGEAAGGALGAGVPAGVGTAAVTRPRGQGVATGRVDLQTPALGASRKAAAGVGAVAGSAVVDEAKAVGEAGAGTAVPSAAEVAGRGDTAADQGHQAVGGFGPARAAGGVAVADWRGRAGSETGVGGRRRAARDPRTSKDDDSTPLPKRLGTKTPRRAVTTATGRRNAAVCRVEVGMWAVAAPGVVAPRVGAPRVRATVASAPAAGASRVRLPEA